ncbi:MAG: radical SAM/SPASM domain-containing protein, partial [Acidobacteriota bacterium]
MTANRSKSLLPILQSSPLDTTAVGCRSSRERAENRSWIPSRYNIRAKAADGRLILWNTLSSAMNVFEASQAAQILPLLKRAGVEGERLGLIGYMVDRGYLVPRGGNEYRRFQLAFGRQHYRPDHLELILLASEDCNFRCTYCYEDFRRGTMRPDVRASVRRLVERKLNGLRSLKISWFGGEPLYGLAAIDELAPFF